MKKIAIIEDDYAILDMYALKFKFAKFNVVTAKDGEEGLKVIEQEKPVLILLDLMMPLMDGATMLARLRKEPWGKKVPVIILTNLSADEMPPKLDRLMIADYVVKASTTPQLVLEKVNKILRTSEKVKSNNSKLDKI